ncbi:MAG TPA: serine O-acetyltransferase [Planctomycetaceae bacterium]|jgi:serine O-acetyltransferase|nr:serine O-acetyltransferase [Planctomycetaceae bacterium]
MSDTSANPQTTDPIWTAIRAEAWSEEDREPILKSLLYQMILKQRRLEDAIGLLLSGKLATEALPAILLRDLFNETFTACPQIGREIRDDLWAVRDRDPASRGYLSPFLYFKGFHALQCYRVAHWFWTQERSLLAIHLQNRISEVFGVDIHPAAQIGSGVLIDHGTGVVIGETAVVESNVSILHDVTLGGTGKETGDRHPKVRQGVLIGAGAKVLGNVEIGAGAKIGAGSVVLDPVPPHTTVAGVPARVVGRSTVDQPALEMDQQFPHIHAEGSGI